MDDDVYAPEYDSALRTVLFFREADAELLRWCFSETGAAYTSECDEIIERNQSIVGGSCVCKFKTVRINAKKDFCRALLDLFCEFCGEVPQAAAAHGVSELFCKKLRLPGTSAQKMKEVLMGLDAKMTDETCRQRLLELVRSSPGILKKSKRRKPKRT